MSAKAKNSVGKDRRAGEGGGRNYLPQRLGALDQIRCHIELVEMIIPTAAVARFHLVGIVQAVKRRLRDVHAARGGRGGGVRKRGVETRT